MKERIESLQHYSDSKERQEILEDCMDIDNISQNLYKFQNEIWDNVSKLLSNCYISWAGMLKIKMIDSPHGGMFLHIFGGELSWKIPENIHIHDFQAISFVSRWSIDEQQFLFSQSSESSREVYWSFLNMMCSISIEQRDHILHYLDQYMVGRSVDSIWLLDDFCLKNDISLYKLSLLHTVYASSKITENKMVLWEKFKDIGLFDLSFYNNRQVKESETYFLPAEIWHRIENSSDTTTIFIFDKTYKSCWYEKSSPETVIRWNGKRLSYMQQEFEKRKCDWYISNPKTILQKVNDEINYIIK